MITKLQFTALFIFSGILNAAAGTLSYVAVPPVQSDANCGIDNRSQYTTAIEGSNASGNNRVINGVTLYPLAGSGQSASADNCTINVLSGTLANSPRANGVPQADGTFGEILSGMTSNDGATDNSQQEIVLDPASLTPGTTYDLRIYIANSGALDREVNLAFAGDGQPPAETGFFNEDDARTSPGGFRDQNQAYYIDYRFAWDGSSAPGVTITQKSGQAPFALFAVTNQPAIEETANVSAAAPPAEIAPPPQSATTALVSAVPDQVGVTSETFYSHESLKKHGRWVEVKKYGRCWQPTDVPRDWRPYSRGHFAYSDDGGYVWIADPAENDWGWACYHYGRWCRVPGVGSGWAWVPGTAWSGAWVSWRQGRDREHAFVGWAPLPPEATLRTGVGISTWADHEYDIGPDYYTFINVRDFGSDSYWQSGLIVDRHRYADIIPHTVNVTNINYTNSHGGVSNMTITQVRAYDGGPDFTFINSEIQKRGGREIARIRVDRVGTENFNGVLGSRLEGNTFVVFTPHVKRDANPRVLPQVAATVPDNKIDHGWAEIKNQKLRTQLKNDIAQQTQGQTPATTKAVLPPQVIQAAAQTAATPAPVQFPQPSAATITASPAAVTANPVTHLPSAPPVANSPIPSPPGALAGASPLPAASQSAATTKVLHPGEKRTPPALATGGSTPTTTGSASPVSGAAVTSALSAESKQTPAPRVFHPGQKVESKPVQSPAVATNVPSPSPTAGVAQSPIGKVQRPGEKIVSAPGQMPAAARGASPTPNESAAITRTEGKTSPIAGLHPGAKIAPNPVQKTPAPIAGASASPVVSTQPSPARSVQTRGAVTGASPSPMVQPTRAVVGRPNQQRTEPKALLTPTPNQAQVTTTPTLPISTRTAGRSVETVQTPPPGQTPTRKPTPPTVTREQSTPSMSGSSQQQSRAAENQKREQQFEETIRQQQHQKQQEQVEQKLQQQQLEQQQKLKQQEQKQAQQAQQMQAQQKQQEAAQSKEHQLQQEKQEQLQQQQNAQKREAQKQQEAAQQKERQLQQQQAAQKRETQLQAQKQQQEAAQQKERQAQQLREQQAQQRQQELKQQQARQLQQQQAEQQRLRQQQLQQQQTQQQQMRQQQLQEQRQQQQSQQQNRRATTPTPSPGG